MYFPVVDFLRGLGALVILVWHYHHFYFTRPYFSPEAGSPVWDYSAQPFYSALSVFYHHGAWAVQFFWVLSGFVFAHVYAAKKTGALSFFVLRFSRLYPLHFLTLLLIAGLQYASLHSVGHFQVLAINDVYHFLLHLFFASNWGFERGYSFNSPIWSISVEEVAYWGFWLIAARRGRFTLTKSLLFTLVAFFALRKTGLIGQCFFYFMAGSTSFLAFRAVETLRGKAHLWCALTASAVILAVMAGGWLPGPVVDAIAPVVAKMEKQLLHATMATCFCAMVVGAAVLDTTQWLKRADAAFLFVGSLTYSTYLWHLPLQVLVLVWFDLNGWGREVFNERWALVLFVCVMVMVGRLSFVYIERPAQLAIRRRFGLASRGGVHPTPVTPLAAQPGT